MSLKIRLSRGGAKKRPFYRVVVADGRSPRDGRFIERLGTYDPMLKKDDANRVKLNEERIRHWLGNGAQPTDRVARMLGVAGIIPAPTFSNPEKAKPRAKTQERLKATAEAAAEEAPAEAAPAEEAVAAKEAPAGEAAPAKEAAPAEEPAAEEAEPKKDNGD